MIRAYLRTKKKKKIEKQNKIQRTSHWNIINTQIFMHITSFHSELTHSVIYFNRNENSNENANENVSYPRDLNVNKIKKKEKKEKKGNIYK